MRAILAATLVLAAQQAVAQQAEQDWATHDGDVALSDAQMQEQVIGQELVFYDNGVSLYGADGSYSYTYDGGGTAYGVYTLQDNGVVCTQFQNGFDRCDMIVRNGARLLVITQKGDRFPVRP